MYTCDYLRLIEIFWIINLSFFVCVVCLFLLRWSCLLYTGAGNVGDGTMKDVLEWVSCSFKNSYFVYMYICVNVISNILIFYEERNLFKYNVSK